MPDISIRERIARQIAVVVGNTTGINGVKRVDDRGQNLKDADALVATGQESTVGETINFLNKQLTATVYAKILVPDSENRSTDEISNLFIARISNAVMADPRINDGEPLAVDTRPERSRRTGFRSAGSLMSMVQVEFRIRYDHVRDDMTKGKGITTLTE